MGQIEDSGRKRKRKRDVKRAILAAVQITALTGIALAAPGLPIALKKLGLLPKFSRDASTIGRTRRTLIKQGFLKPVDGKMRLTAKGQTYLKLKDAEYSAGNPKGWDGRWRVLIFDIPEYRRTVRDKIRRTLMHIGFVSLQKSVWAYPYDCEDLVVLLKADFKIGKDLLYMIVDELEYDRSLRKEFGLQER